MTSDYDVKCHGCPLGFNRSGHVQTRNCDRRLRFSMQSINDGTLEGAQAEIAKMREEAARQGWTWDVVALCPEHQP